MALFELLFLSLLLFSLSIKTTSLTQAHCLPHQRDALIQLKQGFNTTELYSWNATTDCCIWEAITCDKQTGMVTALNLNDQSISGKLDPALFNLSSLQYLDLSWNNFYNISLPQTGFEQLGNLTHLDLSYSGFAGQVPITISSLTNLISLDLSDDDEHPNPLYLHDTGLKILLGNLTKLQVLIMDYVDISLNGSEWGNSIFQVGPTLQELSMIDCGLRGNFPDEIVHLTNLTTLYLSSNSMLSGPLPDSIGNLQYLLELSLDGCNFYGEVPPSITNLTRLKYLNLGSNRLTGAIPMSLFSHHSLKGFDLSNNQFSGYLPEFSNGSSILEYISNENNNLQGKLPISIFKFPKLTDLDLSSNNFNGTLNLDIIKHIESLDSLDLSNNKLSIIEDKNHNESFYASFPMISDLNLRSCNLTKFPSFLSYQKNLYILDLSNNSLTGEIPLSICNMSWLTVVDLSHNNLTGTVPPCLLSLYDLNLKSNKLSGPLPQNVSQPCGFKAINLNGNFISGSLPKLLMYCNALEVLDVGNNRIVNRFPYWLGNLKKLIVLVLRSNMFYGQISDVKIKTKGNYSFFPMLKILDLSSNHFNGTLPKNLFVNLKAMMGVSNTSSIDYDFEMILIPHVASVSYKGLSFDLKDKIGIFSYIDLSNNEIWGRIPEEIGQLKELDVLNLSHNALTNSITLEFANLQQLQILDLSSNQLSGHIPQELTSLTFLSALNLSYNILVGEIPEARQFSTFLNDSYLGNPGLCGSPLTMQCATAPSNHRIYKGLRSKSSTDIIGLSISIGLGLGVGFASVIWATISWEIGRKWFNFNIDRFYFRYFH